MPECKNLKIAEEFLVKHGWPMKLSDANFNRCYCDHCYTSDEEDTYDRGGELYVIPRGYTRFGVKVDDAFAEHHDMWDKWTNCYHGTSIISAKSIIEHRQLLLPGETTMKGAKIVMPAGHIVGQQFFFTTPTIKYAELPAYASQYEFESPSTKKYYNIKVVLQCKQKPGSYTVQGETVGWGRKSRICPFIPNDKMEWKTTQRSSIWPYAILLLIQQHGSRLEALTRRGTTMSDKRPVKETSKWEEVDCPHCHSSQDWVDPEHNQGVILTCKSKICSTKFKPFKCPHCTEVMTFCSCSSRYANERYFTCENSNCAKELVSRKCPNCRTGFNFCQIPNKNQAVTVYCAYKTCKTKSYVFMCPHCNELTHENHEVTEEGIVITCSDKHCLKRCQLARCPKCLHVNVCENGRSKVGRSDTVTCAYKCCSTKFKQPLKPRVCKVHH